MASKRTQGRDIQAPSVSWLDQLAEELSIESAPPGWKTLSELQSALNCSWRKARSIVSMRGLKAKMYKAKNGKPAMHYHP